ncbi:nucleosidase [Streptomyces sp. NPDC004539]|uniref:5'-methylthioadenosine/S-adenosylhomocysteine nucleosidase family protein n=1 Tax=Streptomyces sp. NPDC004539 TaxID=3154280 RepID=UPI0033B50B8D
MTPNGTTGPVAVVLTTHPTEYLVLRAALEHVERLVHPAGTVVERGRLPGTRWLVALAETDEGATHAAALTERLYTWLAPRTLLLVGVARPLADRSAPGEVVVPTKVYGIQGGEESGGGFRHRPEAWRPSHRLLQTARHALRGRARFAPVAVSDAVLENPGAPLSRRVRDHYSDAVATETDATGAVHAAHLTGSLPVLVVRGVAGSAREERERAATGAALAALAVLRAEKPPSGAARSAVAVLSAAVLALLLGGGFLWYDTGTAGRPTGGSTAMPDVPVPEPAFNGVVRWTDDGRCPQESCPADVYASPSQGPVAGAPYSEHRVVRIACQKDTGARASVGPRYSGHPERAGIWFRIAGTGLWLSAMYVDTAPYPLPAVCR